MRRAEIDTEHGVARAELHCAHEARAALLLGHGAGGGVSAVDLVETTRAANGVGVHVALVEQPYRVAGRRAPAPARQLDAAWLAVADELGELWFPGLPLVFGGRSSGARVACRTSAEGQACAVLCLAFPLYPPRRGGGPQRSRQDELDAVDVPVLVVQGEQDPFGCPEPVPHREVVQLAGDHSLAADLAGLSRIAGEWLDRVLHPLDVEP